MWKRMSIMGLMDRVERVFSLYPFSNARLLSDEARRLAILKAQKPPEPYRMANDLVKRLKVPRLEDFGPGGLLGYTRA